MSSANREEALFVAVVEKLTAAERAAYLEGACGDDHALRARIEALLAAHDGSGGVLDAPPSGLNATVAARQTPAAGPGTHIGPYKLLQELGEGGMGTVYMAEQQQPVRRMVALKVIKPGMDSKEVLARFEAERQAIALMDHPNIAKVLDAGTVGSEQWAVGSEEDSAAGRDNRVRPGSPLTTHHSPLTPQGRPYFVMELVKGVPITKYCDDHQLSPRERLELFVPICQAIQHAHQKGVIHRDIKPSNVLVAKYDGRPVPKVIDFGVAKAMGKRLTDRTLFTAFGNVVGTLEYMSPEQAELNALDVDTRSDVYALGVLLYELLTGSTPLSRKRLTRAALGEALRLIREEEPPKPSTRLSTAQGLASIAEHRKTEAAKLTKMMRGELDWMVMQALDKDRNRRYESASALAADVQRYLRDEPVAACPPSAGYRLRKFARRHKAGLRTTLAAAGVLLLAVVGVSWVLWDRAAQGAALEADRSRRLAETEQTVNAALFKAEQLHDRAGELPSATSREADAVLVLWAQADAALGQAEAAMKAGTADARLRERVLAMHKQVQQGRNQAERRRAQGLKKETLLRDLDAARLAQATWIDAHFDFAGAAAKFAAAFAAYGLEVTPGRAKELARQLRADEPAVREALIVALDVWARAVTLAKTKWSATELRAIATAADVDQWRKTFRAALDAKNTDALLKLSADARQLALPPASLQLLAVSLKTDRAGGSKEAIALLRWARGRYPGDFWIACELGGLLGSKDGADRTEVDIEEQIGCLRVALALRPDASIIHSSLGLALRNKNQLDEAIAAFRTAIDIDAKNTFAYSNLGNALRAKKQLDEAIAAFRTAIEINPRFAAAYTNLGNALRDKKQLDEAIAAHRKAIEINPKFAIAYNNLGDALRDKKQLDEAIAALRTAIEINPKFATAYTNLGNALWDKKQLDEAIAAHRKAIEINPKDARAYNNLGAALWSKKQVDEAIVAYRKAIEINPKDARAYDNLGIALRDKKQIDEAIAAFRTAIEINPKYANAYYNLGNALLDEAIAAFRMAIEIDPKNALVQNLLGDTLKAKNQLDEAISVYLKAIELEPKNVTRLNDLAWLLATHPEPKVRAPGKAVDLARKAVELAPKDGNIWNTLGVAHYRAGDWKAAVAALDKSMALREGGDGLDWFFLAMAHWQMGEKDEARNWYDRAVQWMDANKQALEKNTSDLEELSRFRSEAAEVLGIQAPPAQSKDAPLPKK